MKVGDPIRLILSCEEHASLMTKRFGIDSRLIKGQIESTQGGFYLVKLESVKIQGEVVYGFFETEIELDLQTLRERILDKLSI